MSQSEVGEDSDSGDGGIGMSSDSPNSLRRAGGGDGVPLKLNADEGKGDVPRPPFPPSPLPRRSIVADPVDAMSSPPPLRRRSFPRNGGDGGPGQTGGDDVGAPPEADHWIQSAALAEVITDDRGGSAPRDVPSRFETDSDGYGYGSPETRRVRGSFAMAQRWGDVARGRNRSFSSDIALTVSSRGLPRYDEDFAFRIASISDADIELHQRDEQASFSTGAEGGSAPVTPDRQAASPLAMRDRANTCPHRPQRHSIFRNGVDEESGRLGEYDEIETSDESLQHDSGGAPTNTPSFHSPYYDANEALNSPDRRVRLLSSQSPAISVPTTEEEAVSPLSLAVPTPTRRPSSRTPVSPSFSTPRSTLATAAGIPSRSPQISAGPLSGASPSAATITPGRRSCVLRLNHNLMRVLMVLSLYMLLAYTWDSDLRQRYKSAEINYGLSEYWHDGDLSKIGVLGKPSTDEGDVEAGGELLARLVNEGRRSESRLEDSSDSIEFLHGGRGRPSLSHARASRIHLARDQRRRRAVAHRNTSGGTLSRLAWALVWMGFTLPVMEAGLREARRRFDARIWNVRRPRPFRSVLSNRMQNVHDL